MLRQKGQNLLLNNRIFSLLKSCFSKIGQDHQVYYLMVRLEVIKKRLSLNGYRLANQSFSG